MPESLLRENTSAVAERAEILSSQLFFECNQEGRIVWMSEAARARFGDSLHLSQGVAKEQDAELRRYLEQCKPGDIIRVSYDTRWNRAVPVSFSCLIRASHHLLLTAEVRERAADRMRRTGDGLSVLENRMLRHYFRLLRIQQSLDSRLERGRRNPGPAVVMEQLERERARLGRELHTGAGQAYSAIRYQLEWIEKKAPDLPEEIRECLQRIGKAAQDADTEVRAVSQWLHPPDWQALSLADALRNLWHTSGIPETFQASLTLDKLDPEPPHWMRIAIYRIVQEGLSNAIRHSGATQLVLTLKASERTVLLRLEDNGRGFDAAAGNGKGIGLRSMREQVKALGGEMLVQSGAQGTILEVRIPSEAGDE